MLSRRLVACAVVSALLTPAVARAQGNDVFASDDSYWHRKRRDFPQCAELVNQHETLTRRLYDLGEEARRAVEPRRRQVLQQINQTAAERTKVQKQLDACTKDVTVSNRPSSTRLSGGIVENDLDPATTARIQELAARLAQAGAYAAGAFDEFFKGVADWAQTTLEFLAQNPGVPVQQMGQGIISYLTNNNAANHAMLRGAAEKAVAEFQQNPARFLGEIAPNFIPLPKGQALAQLAKVEAGAGRVLAVAANEQKFARAYSGMLADAEKKIGAGAAANACFAKNACMQKALAQDILWRTGQPFEIKGVQALLKDDLAMTRKELFNALRNHTGGDFAPRRSGLYNPEQLDSIWQGIPIPSTPEEMGRLLQRNGEGSQGIAIAQIKPSAAIDKEVLGHGVNMRYEKGDIEVLDNSGLRINPADVESWWFYPTR